MENSIIYQQYICQEQQALDCGILAILEKQTTRYAQSIRPKTMTKYIDQQPSLLPPSLRL